ncbi:MAG: rRNA maturation RNase YbeY [Solirubrobacteraceae bacterium]
MLEVEAIGFAGSDVPGAGSDVPGAGSDVPGAGSDAARGSRQLPGAEEVRELCVAAAGALGVSDGHLAVELVHARRIAQLNRAHRGVAKPTDVLSFPIDGVEEQGGVQRELGDVVICPEHTVDVREAIVHGVLHLLGMDHEADDGQMLALQDQLIAGHAAGRRPPAGHAAGRRPPAGHAAGRRPPLAPAAGRRPPVAPDAARVPAAAERTDATARSRAARS